MAHFEFPDVLSDDSPLTRLFPGFEPRKGQKILADNVTATLRKGRLLVCEAGTGTGKTLAYLVPLLQESLQSGKKAVVSTDTKTLQAQIQKKELPLIERLFEAKIKSEVCLGAGNYVCRRKLQRRRPSPAEKKSDWYRSFLEWESKTPTGILNEFPGNAPPAFLAQVARESDTCMGPACPNFSSSHYFQARERWRRADLLIVNHSLLSRHLLSENGLLPEFHFAVIDEAHRFPDAFNAQCEAEFTFRELQSLVASLPWAVPGILDGITGLSDALRQRYGASTRRTRIREALVVDGIDELLQAVTGCVKDLQKEQNAVADLFGQEVEPGEKALRMAMLLGRLQSAGDILDLFCQGPGNDQVLSLQIEKEDVRFNVTPVDSADRIRELFIEKIEAIVFASATLTVQGSMKFFLRKLGLGEQEARLRSLRLDSPFEYAKRCLLYIPPNLPEPAPGDSRFEAACASEITRLIQLSGGGALIVFSSIRSLQAVEGAVRALPFPVFSSVSEGAERALERFRETPDAVLLGLESYRQGLDVQGDRLRMVVIVRLPFPVPDDPLLEARMEREKEIGENPFLTLQLPEMILKMRQGFGRLIRSSEDRGAVAILDPRVLSRSYGRILTGSLPAARRVSSFEELQAAWARLFAESSR